MSGTSLSEATPQAPGTVERARKWIIEHKLQSVGVLWGTSVAGSILYNFRKEGEKMSVKIIHARLHAQALTLAALVASAGVEYWEHHSGEKAHRYKDHVQ